jgi:hypothetical protein
MKYTPRLGQAIHDAVEGHIAYENNSRPAIRLDTKWGRIDFGSNELGKFAFRIGFGCRTLKIPMISTLYESILNAEANDYEPRVRDKIALFLDNNKIREGGLVN